LGWSRCLDDRGQVIWSNRLEVRFKCRWSLTILFDSCLLQGLKRNRMIDTLYGIWFEKHQPLKKIQTLKRLARVFIKSSVGNEDGARTRVHENVTNLINCLS